MGNMNGTLAIGQIVAMVPLRSLADALDAVPDPRAVRYVRYGHSALLVVAVCAMLGGSSTHSRVMVWANANGRALFATTDLGTRMAPSGALVIRLLDQVDRQRFETILFRWAIAQGMPAFPLATTELHGRDRDVSNSLPGLRVAIAYGKYVESLSSMQLVENSTGLLPVEDLPQVPATIEPPGWNVGLPLAEIRSTIPLRTLLQAFRNIPDPRAAAGKRYEYGVLLLLLTCAILGGARTKHAACRWIAKAGYVLLRSLDIPVRTAPTARTIEHFLEGLDRDRFEDVLRRLVQTHGGEEVNSLANDDPVDGDNEALPGIRILMAYRRYLGARTS